ncbi:MAG: tRNA (adenosine(37)-N6)-threonylcarbamoyltransferase complex transferase subunit TsaD [Nitratireductor sp.]
MLVLGIETSCDETAASLVQSTTPNTDGGPKGEILSNVVHSQIDEHAAYGGVVPEIASRAHLSKLDFIIEAALKEAGKELTDIDAIAVTAGPGLAGGLLTGLMTAKALSFAANIPYFAINHLEGHALTARLTNQIEYPYLLLLVSGGHSQFLEINGLGNYTKLATTIDDALGEAFDKTAKLLSLGHPGGPLVEKAALNGDPKRFAFPRPLPSKTDMNFSFSGLKTAVRKAAQENAPLSNQDIADICASFQQAVVDVLSNRTKKMIAKFNETHKNLETKNLVVAGGVAANQKIKQTLEQTCKAHGYNLITPPAHLCTDNAAMIAWAGVEHFEVSTPSSLNVAPRSRWPLDETAKTVLGSGKRGAKA